MGPLPLVLKALSDAQAEDSGPCCLPSASPGPDSEGHGPGEVPPLSPEPTVLLLEDSYEMGVFSAMFFWGGYMSGEQRYDFLRRLPWRI